MKTSGLFKVIKTGQKYVLTGTMSENFQASVHSWKPTTLLKTLSSTFFDQKLFISQTPLEAATDKVFSLIESQRFS